MKCLNPFLRSSKLPPPWRTVHEVPCGKCMHCRIMRTAEWKTRLIHATAFKPSCFITLTYDQQHIPEAGCLNARDLELFWKRFRQNLKKTTGEKISYYACGEYGDRYERPHYHAIVIGWFPPMTQLRKLGRYYSADLVSRSWDLGYNVVGSCTPESIQYVTGYIRKALSGPLADIKYGNRPRPFARSSKGLGLDYARTYLADQIRVGDGITVHGRPASTPRYYRKHLLSFKDKYSMFWRHWNQLPDDVRDQLNVKGDITPDDWGLYYKLRQANAQRIENDYRAFERLIGKGLL